MNVSYRPYGIHDEFFRTKDTYMITPMKMSGGVQLDLSSSVYGFLLWYLFHHKPHLLSDIMGE